MLCAVALLAVGLAHRMPAAHALTPIEVAAYTLPDGTLPVICLADGGADTQKGKGGLTAKDCEACRISAGILLPPSPETANVAMPLVAATVLPMKAEAFYRQLFPPSAAPRAPPADPVTV